MSAVASLTPATDLSLSVRSRFVVEHYDLDVTLASGQTFRWRRSGNGWVGVVGSRWVRLESTGTAILAETTEPVSDWAWLTDYLQSDLDLNGVLRTFPQDEAMRTAVIACQGLRLLRQEPWECLASFILSSTKQIVQIQQIIASLCETLADPVPTPPNELPVKCFPGPEVIARTRETDLRACKMGFRAPYLLASARKVASGQIDLSRIGGMPLEEARETLTGLPGVGRKIADCVLLFAYGFQSAFPVDVWVMRALQQLYFPKQPVNLARLRQFSAEYFGPNAGYAQQYLFHYMRTKAPRDQSRAS
jgi:N-glycosylase/DNA lyase